MAIEPASISTSPPLTLHAQPFATRPLYNDTPARGNIYPSSMALIKWSNLAFLSTTYIEGQLASSTLLLHKDAGGREEAH